MYHVSERLNKDGGFEYKVRPISLKIMKDGKCKTETNEAMFFSFLRRVVILVTNQNTAEHWHKISPPLDGGHQRYWVK